MSVYIRIDKCSECPHQVVKEKFFTTFGIPVCSKVNRELPHEVEYTLIPGSRCTVVTAIPTDVIPSWCPFSGDRNEA